MKYRTFKIMAYIVGTLVAPAAIAASVTIRFPVEYSPDILVGQSNRDFIQRVEQSSEGRIKVRFSPNGATFKGNELVQALLRGDAQMTTAIPAFWSSISPRVQLLDLPYAFPSEAVFDRLASNKELVQRVYSEVEAKGAKVLGLMRTGYIIPGTRDRQLITPADFDGVKLRGMGKVNTMTVKALGANAISLNVTEVMSAIQQGLVDGTQTLIDVYTEYKYYDYLKHITHAHYQLLYYPWTVNARWWDSLEESDRALIQKAVDEAIEAHHVKVDEMAAAAETELRSHGVNIVRLTPEQEQALAERTRSVWTELEGEIGKELMTDFERMRDGQ